MNKIRVKGEWVRHPQVRRELPPDAEVIKAVVTYTEPPKEPEVIRAVVSYTEPPEEPEVIRAVVSYCKNDG